MGIREMPRAINKAGAKIKPKKCLFWAESALLNTTPRSCVQKPHAGCSGMSPAGAWAPAAGLGPRRQGQDSAPGSPPRRPGTLASRSLQPLPLKPTQPGPPSLTLCLSPSPLQGPSAHPTHLSPTNSNSSFFFFFLAKPAVCGSFHARDQTHALTATQAMAVVRVILNLPSHR